MFRTTIGSLSTAPGRTPSSDFVVSTSTTGSPTTAFVRAVTFFPLRSVYVYRTSPASPGLLPLAATRETPPSDLLSYSERTAHVICAGLPVQFPPLRSTTALFAPGNTSTVRV